MDTQQRLDVIKTQNRERAKRYYEANKEAIAERRKQKRIACRNAMAKVDNAPPQAEPAPIRVVTRSRAIAGKVVEAVAPQVKAAPQAQVKNKGLSVKQARQIITDNVEAISSRRSYLSQLNTLYDLLQCDDVETCFRNHKETISAIDSATIPNGKKEGEEYAVNSKKQMIQTILKLVTILDLKLSEDAIQAYRDQFDVYKVMSSDQTDEKKSVEVMDFNKYLAQVKARYGEVSKEFIIASLYSEDGFRDDLQLNIVRNDEKDSDENLLVVPASSAQPIMIILNKYKTKGRYGTKKITLSMELSTIIRQYIQQNKMKLGSYLFGEQSLSPFVARFNKAMGLDITINTLRHMMVAKELSRPGLTPAQRVALARKLNHSITTSQSYNRVVKQ